MGPQSRRRRHHHPHSSVAGPAQKPVIKSQAAFVPKLFSMLEEEERGLISWSANGERFSVYNPIDFSKLILPQHFKHNNWQSFVRQLNMYGFHKVNDSLSSGQAWEFRHPHFRRGRLDLLPLIKRKSTRSPTQPSQQPTPTQLHQPHPPLPPPPPPTQPTQHHHHHPPLHPHRHPAPAPPPPPPPPLLLLPTNHTPHRITPYDPVRDPGGVTLAPGGARHEQISQILRMMLGLISTVVTRDVADELEATRQAIGRFEEDCRAEVSAQTHLPLPLSRVRLDHPPDPSEQEEGEDDYEDEDEEEDEEEEMEEEEEEEEEEEMGEDEEMDEMDEMEEDEEEVYEEEEGYHDGETDSSLKNTSGTRDSKSI